ncbi:putative oxidoreductase,short chain dehydrogenase [Xylaria acuta]|nr:putative oxidoreductase,short chain dehydrogenase [Xylaria acuta]
MTAPQIIKDEELECALQDRVFLVTGCSSGVVFLTVRDQEKGKSVCESFLDPSRVELLEFGSSMLDFSSKLNVLVCNAGAVQIPGREETTEGFEMQLVNNYSGHFLLFWLLNDAMLESTNAARHASETVFDDFHLKQDKMAQIYMANYVNRNFGSDRIRTLSLTTDDIDIKVLKYSPVGVRDGWGTNPMIWIRMENPEKCAATTVLAAVGKEWEGKGGKYLDNCGIAASQLLVPVMDVKDYAYDETNEEKLWELILKTLGLS